MTPFTPRRPSGLSDRAVVYEFARNAAPGQLFGYPALINALQAETDCLITQPIVSRAVREANRQLLREQCRLLVNVPNVGYRVAAAKEHANQSLVRKDRAGRQVRFGLAIVRQTRMDELTADDRKMHTATLIMMQQMAQAIDDHEVKIQDHARLLDTLAQRVDRLEVAAGTFPSI